MDEEESFFNLVTQFQSKRMDDQRCSLAIIDNKENQQASTLPSNIHGEYFYPGNRREGKLRPRRHTLLCFVLFIHCVSTAGLFFAYYFDREPFEIERRFNGPDRRHAESSDG